MFTFTARKNQKLKVTKHQMELLVGCILGDAYISKKGKIQIEHSTKQLSYTMWKYAMFSNISYGKPTKVDRFDSRYNKHYSSIRFWIRQYFRPLRELFYPNGVKIFPIELSEYFTSKSLAVWYMDDGNLYKNNAVKISADNFDNQSRDNLVELLSDKFLVQSTIQKSGKIRISSNSLSLFFDTVKPFIHSSMKYKIP